MSFRKRNVGIASAQRAGGPVATETSERVRLPGIKPSAIDGRPVTSTGTSTLDGLLAGHAGLAMGSSLLIEENGTTDYAGALLRFYAAEGLMQGHHVHVIGLPEQWGRELPGVVGEVEAKAKKAEVSSEKLKIAWRYERLGQQATDSVTRDRPLNTSHAQSPNSAVPIFCHTFDLSKRLVHPPNAQLSFLMLEHNPSRSPFDVVIAKLSSAVTGSPLTTVHRILVPALLSPALYPSHAAMPQYLLKFQHDLRSLLAAHSERVTIMQSMPLFLHPRSSGLTRWVELLNDGVIELSPFPHSADAEFQVSRDPETKDEPPQGMLKVHCVPIFHDRASGIAGQETDWTFTMSRRKFIIKPYNLPPIDGDNDAQQDSTTKADEAAPKKKDLEF